MTIQTASGFLAAVDTVRAFFTAQGVTANVEVGWRRRPQQINQGTGGANRVVFSPSIGDSGGAIVSARFPGNRRVRDGSGNLVGDVRSLQDWTRECTVSVWAVDATDLHNEELQIAATESLFEWVVRAVHVAPGAFAEAKFTDVKWTIPAERSYGVELLASLTFKHPIFDVPRDLVIPAGVAVSRELGSVDVDPSPSVPGDAG